MFGSIFENGATRDEIRRSMTQVLSWSLACREVLVKNNLVSEKDFDDLRQKLLAEMDQEIAKMREEAIQQAKDESPAFAMLMNTVFKDL